MTVSDSWKVDFFLIVYLFTFEREREREREREWLIFLATSALTICTRKKENKSKKEKGR